MQIYNKANRIEHIKSETEIFRYKTDILVIGINYQSSIYQLAPYFFTIGD